MLSWNVLFEDFNKREIVTYDIFKGGHYEKIAKELKKETNSKEEFVEEFRVKLMSQFWSRSEYEVVVTSWPPYIDKEELDRLNQEDVKYRANVRLTVGKKIDIFNQLEMNWNQFIDYVWNNI
ncbi:MAG: hypothetical protein II305_02725 [Clostridia bacterium]|nr:hypothetical protein [Clostridia bacterium]